MVLHFKETNHSIFTATSALSRGILKQKKGKSTIHLNGDFMNTELLFQTVNSVNQLSIYAVVTNWCYDKEPSSAQVNNQIMAVVQPEEVNMMVYWNNAFFHTIRSCELPCPKL